MTKKIILSTLFILLTAALVAGGIYRTSAKSGYAISLGGENIVEITQNPDNHTPRALGAQEGQQNGERAAQGQGNGGQGQGRNRQAEENLPGQEVTPSDGTNGQGRGGQGKEYDGNGGQGQGQQGQGYGRNGGGQGQSQGQGLGQGQQQNAEVHDMIHIEGAISQAPAAGVDMILETKGGQILIGTGPGWLQEQGFNLAAGDEVQVSGFYENDEFKAVTITRLSDGQAITLRDEFGRPMWSGAGRRANSSGGGQGI